MDSTLPTPAGTPRTRPVPSRGVRPSSLRSEGSRPSRGADFKTSAWVVWRDNSEAYPSEAKIASRRVKDLGAKGGLDHEELCAALAEYARVPDLSGLPHHAIGFTEYVARTFIARMRDERRLPAQLAAKDDERPTLVRGRMRSVAEILGAA